MSAVLSTAHDKRRRRTRAQVETLERQILEELRADHPQSVRHLFYRMTNSRLPEPVTKNDSGYRHVQHRVTEMRRSGIVPYGWITDATRRGYHTDTFDGAGDFLRRVSGLYRSNLWRDAGVYAEVWVESRSIAGIIEDDCEELAVSLYPAGGFTSISLAHQSAEYINRATGYGEKPAHVIYIGDYDPAGVMIDKSIERELRDHLDPSVELRFDRVAITEQQIEELDLPTNPRKKTDRRSLHITETVEAEAMPAHLMRKLLRQSVEMLLPEHALHVAKVTEESERSFLDNLADKLSAGAT